MLVGGIAKVWHLNQDLQKAREVVMLQSSTFSSKQRLAGAQLLL